MNQPPLHDPRIAPQRGDALFIDGHCWRCSGAGDGLVETAVAGVFSGPLTLADWRTLAARAEAVTVSLRG